MLPPCILRSALLQAFNRALIIINALLPCGNIVSKDLAEGERLWCATDAEEARHRNFIIITKKQFNLVMN